jgi:hypothetical protein
VTPATRDLLAATLQDPATDRATAELLRGLFKQREELLAACLTVLDYFDDLREGRRPLPGRSLKGVDLREEVAEVVRQAVHKAQGGLQDPERPAREGGVQP